MPPPGITAPPVLGGGGSIPAGENTPHPTPPEGSMQRDRGQAGVLVGGGSREAPMAFPGITAPPVLGGAGSREGLCAASSRSPRRGAVTELSPPAGR